jgi:hypothetical protein
VSSGEGHYADAATQGFATAKAPVGGFVFAIGNDILLSATPQLRC